MRLGEHAPHMQVEVKSSRLCMLPQRRCHLVFSGIKLGKFDSLVLGVLNPWAVQIWECKDPASLPLSSKGRISSVNGHTLVIGSSSGKPNPEDAWEEDIFPKLSEVATLMKCWDVGNEMFKSYWLAPPSRTELAYTDPQDPFRQMTHVRRGACFAYLSRLCDNSRKLYVSTLDAAPGMTATCSTKKRSRGNSEYDYARCLGTLCGSICLRKVEVKSARVSWQRALCKWRLEISQIKPALFDDLVLMVYLPSGVEMWEVNLAQVLPRMRSQKPYAKIKGKTFIVYADKSESELGDAWEDGIKPKLGEVATLTTALKWGEPLLAEALAPW